MEESQPSNSSSTTKKFSTLSPLVAFKLIKNSLNPLPDGTNRNRDGSFNIEVPREEAELAVLIKKLGEYEVDIEKHKFLNRCRGTVFDFATINMEEEEIKDELKEYRVEKVLKKSTFDKTKKGKVFTGKLVLTFDREEIPKEVTLGFLRLKVEQYIPDPFLCQNCFQFGNHTKDKCKFKAICGRCCGEPHKEDERCKNDRKCRNCNNQFEHPTWDRKCPVYLKEKEILTVKEIKKVSYKRAEWIVDQRSSEHTHTYSKATARNSIVPSPNGLENKLEKLLETAQQAMEAQLVTAQRALDVQIQKLNESFAERLKHITDTVSALQNSMASIFTARVQASTPIPSPIQFGAPVKPSVYCVTTGDPPTEITTAGNRGKPRLGKDEISKKEKKIKLSPSPSSELENPG